MKHIQKLRYRSVISLLLLMILLAGCTNEGDTESPQANAEMNNTSENKIETNNTTPDDSNDQSQVNNDVSSTPSTNEQRKESQANETESSAKQVEKKNAEEVAKQDMNSNEEMTKERNTESNPQNAKIRKDTKESDKEKAISLVQDYLRDKGQLIEDDDHFVQYDGEINGYIIVRYSTLVSGHSSTNGRYAVNLTNEKVVDMDANAEVLN